jgi:hypothetical protein
MVPITTQRSPTLSCLLCYFECSIDSLLKFSATAAAANVIIIVVIVAVDTECGSNDSSSSDP